MVNTARGGENHGASRREREAHQPLSGNFKIRQTVGRDLHDAARAGERRRNVEIAIHVESQPLRSSQSFIESANRSVGIDLVHAVVRSGHEQVSLRTKGEVVGGNADLESGKDKYLLIASDLENSTVAVAHIKALLMVERDAGGHSHSFRVGAHSAIGSNPIDGAVKARRDIHLSFAVKSNRGGIHHLGDERLYVVIGVNLENRDWNFLAARA